MAKGPEGLGLSPEDIEALRQAEEDVLESRSRPVNLFPTGDPSRFLPGETPEEAHIRLQAENDKDTQR